MDKLIKKIAGNMGWDSRFNGEEIVAACPVARFELPVPVGYPFAQRQDQGDGGFGDDAGIYAGGVNHRYPAFGRGLNIDVVVTHPGAPDDLEIGRSFHHASVRLAFTPDHESDCLSHQGNHHLLARIWRDDHVSEWCEERSCALVDGSGTDNCWLHVMSFAKGDVAVLASARSGPKIESAST